MPGFALFAVGLETETWVLVGAAVLATCASRILYGGSRGPRFKRNDSERPGDHGLRPPL